MKKFRSGKSIYPYKNVTEGIALAASVNNGIFASKKLFARKFDICTDAADVDMLDKHSLALHREVIFD